MEYIRSRIKIANPGISWDKRRILLEKNIHKFLLPKNNLCFENKFCCCSNFAKKSFFSLKLGTFGLGIYSCSVLIRDCDHEFMFTSQGKNSKAE